MTDPTVDTATLNELAELTGDHDPQFLGRLVDLFLKTTPTRVSKIKECFARKDGKGIAFEAHSMKSSSANLGAIPLSEIARTLEAFGNAGTLNTEVEATIKKLEAEFKIVAAALKQFVDSQQTQKAA